MKSIKTDVFSLKFSLFSGQCFGWKEIDDWYYGEIAGKPVKLKQENDTLFFEGTSEEKIRNYLALDEDLKSIYKVLTKNDEILTKAVKEFHGLRILRQDPWETIISFICSAFSNIPRIEKKLSNIRNKYGKEVELDGHKMHLFPSASELSKASVEELRELGLGYRDKYVKAVSDKLSGKNLEELRSMSYEEAKKELLELEGVGEKVADCISLFSLDKHEAFPIDIWIANSMKKYYGDEIKKQFPETKFSYKDVQAFARTKWKKQAGYAQQYIFMYSRNHLKKKKLKINRK